MTAQVSRLRLSDMVRVGWQGLSARPGRGVLTSLGIAVGIAAIVAVVGISASSRADLLAALDELGTNLLRVTPGRTLFGEEARLPQESVAMLRRVGTVETATGVSRVNASVWRNQFIPRLETGGIAVLAGGPDLLPALGGGTRSGRFLDEATAALPTVVLGSVAAERLGIVDVEPVTSVWLEDQAFSVLGILEPLRFHPDLDRAVVIGRPIAHRLFRTEDEPGTIYVRVSKTQITQTRKVIPATVNPERPSEVEISRPSDALEAREVADQALTALLVGLGSVALLVGGLAIANIQVMSVLERRTEIGVRRALGAKRGHIRAQFLIEAITLAGLGGVAGAAVGAIVTALYSYWRGWTLSLPVPWLGLAILIALLLGGLAGLYPAQRAARVPPAEAVRSV